MHKHIIYRFLSIVFVVAVISMGWISFRYSSNNAMALPDDQSYKLVWQDEFDGNNLNTDNWDYQTGGWNASGVQNCYKSNNIAVSNGTLKIIARYEPGVRCSGGTRDFTSGFVQTKNKQTWTYGYFEARMRLPVNNGNTWPAFWMSPNQATYGSWPASGEIDVIEAKGHDLSYVSGNAHWGTSQKRVQRPKITRINTGDWHVYAVKWQEGKLEFFVDGQLYHTIDNFSNPNAAGHPGPFNIPFYLRLNMAIGGTYLDAPHNDAHNNINSFPATMEVDYVRVYQKSNHTNTAPANPGSTPPPSQPAEPQHNHNSSSPSSPQTSNNPANTPAQNPPSNSTADKPTTKNHKQNDPSHIKKQDRNDNVTDIDDAATNKNTISTNNDLAEDNNSRQQPLKKPVKSWAIWIVGGAITVSLLIAIVFILYRKSKKSDR